MKVTRIFAVAIATLGLAGFSGVASADAAAGKAKFEAVCAECHEAGDFAGEDAAALGATLKKMVAGQQKHKTALKLSDAEIADLAAYMAAGK
jgi:mono/diheme cytochrome c family protein